MTFNSEIISPNIANKQLSIDILKSMRMLLAGLIAVSLLAIGFFNISQTNSNSTNSRFERSCECDRGCLCGTDCNCSNHKLK